MILKIILLGVILLGWYWHEKQVGRMRKEGLHVSTCVCNDGIGDLESNLQYDNLIKLF